MQQRYALQMKIHVQYGPYLLRASVTGVRAVRREEVGEDEQYVNPLLK